MAKKSSCDNCKRLQAQVSALQAQVAGLQERLARARKDSSTSSKPPSSDIVKPPPPPPPDGHKAVQSVSFSPDGKTLASGGDDDTVRLWDMTSEKEKATLRGHIYPVECVAFSPDGKILASGSKRLVTIEPKTRLLADEGEIRLWDSDSGRTIAILRGHTATISSMGFSPDGKTLASGSGDTVRLWEVATGKQKTAFPRTHESGFVVLAFSPDGKSLATASGDKTIKLWDMAGRIVITTFKGQGATVTSLAFSPNGKTLASGASDWTARLWNVPVNKESEK